MNATKKKKVLLLLMTLLVAVVMFASAQISALAAVNVKKIHEADGKYFADYSNYAELREAGNKLNEQVAEEGYVLLKNDGTLPLDKNATKISTFGKYSNAMNRVTGNAGSVPTSAATISLPQSLENAGFTVNKNLLNFYESYEYSGFNVTHPYTNTALSITAAHVKSSNVQPIDFGRVEDTYPTYGDAAVVTLRRVTDTVLSAAQVTSASANAADWFHGKVNGNLVDKGRHIGNLIQSEKDLVDYVSGKFENVIVLINSTQPMDIQWLEDHPGVGAIVWVGNSGDTGLAAIGRFLNGSVNPSGRTADIWDTDVQNNNPAWANYGDLTQNVTDFSDWICNNQNCENRLSGTCTEHKTFLNQYYASFMVNNEGKYSLLTDLSADPLDPDHIGGPTPGMGLPVPIRYLEYEESIYYGYRYYETRGWEEGGKENTPDWSWYNSAVTYPFGHGLSYSKFEWTLDSAKIGDSDLATTGITESNQDDKITVKVNVKNTGSYAGKDVVQVYNTAPYTGGIEKSHVALVGFAKTKTLAPGESQTVKVTFDARDMASWDYNNANGNTKWGCWELDNGAYTLNIMSNSNMARSTSIGNRIAVNFTVAAGSENAVIYDTDEVTGTPLENKFTVNHPTTGEALRYSEGMKWDLEASKGGKADGSHQLKNRYNSLSDNMTLLSRANIKTYRPAAPTKEERTLKTTTGGVTTVKTPYLEYRTLFDPTTTAAENAAAATAADPTKRMSWNGDVPGQPWYKTATDIKSTWTQAAEDTTASRLAALKRTGGTYANATELIMFDEVRGLPKNDPKWDAFLNQLTIADMISLRTVSSYRSPAIEALGVKPTVGVDGNAGFRNNSSPLPENLPTEGDTVNDNAKISVHYVDATVRASTWNVDLSEKLAIMLGNEALYMRVNDWYAPSMNMHRLHFDSRSWEYYSEDGVLSGKIASAEVRGVQSKGMIATIKHFAMFDQAINCAASQVPSMWVDEQNMRENYFRTFEYAVKEGGAWSVMASYGRIGAVPTVNSNPLMTGILREEWGFYGKLMNDAQDILASCTYANAHMMVRAGGDTQLSNRNHHVGKWNATARSGMGIMTLGYMGSETATGGPGNKALDTTKFSDETIESPTNYYWWRQGALNSLYINGNSSYDQKNRTDLSVYEDKDLTVNQNASASAAATIAVQASGDKSALERANAVSLQYELTSGSSLPKGLKLNEYTGALSGTNYESYVGAHTFEADVIADGYVRERRSFTIAAQSVFSLGDTNMSTASTGKVGTAFDQSITTTMENATTKILEYELIGGALPIGLKLSSDGAITGIPTTAGEYNFKLRALRQVTSTSNHGYSYQNAEYYINAVIVIENDILDGYYTKGELDALLGDYLTQTQINTLLSGKLSEAQVKTIVDAAVAGKLSETEVQKLIDEALADNGGCGSTIVTSSVAVALGIMLCAAGLIIFIRKKKEA